MSGNVEIPKKIHFIWMGGKIPSEYLENIRNMAIVCSSMDPPYEVNIWIDSGSRSNNAQNLKPDRLEDYFLRTSGD